MTSQGNSAAGSLSYLRKYLKAADIFIFVGRIFFLFDLPPLKQ
ncbi:hypothetical protein HMPREF1249_1026 [Jonquetella sp. BV3C21]|nr:hypothetical protein HMPREF1249_1026 [Jonquetella sp. BV3C21]